MENKTQHTKRGMKFNYSCTRYGVKNLIIVEIWPRKDLKQRILRFVHYFGDSDGSNIFAVRCIATGGSPGASQKASDAFHSNSY